MQRKPAPAASDVIAQSPGRWLVRDDIHRVCDEEIAALDRVRIPVVLREPRADARVFRKGAEDLQACVVDVVVLAATHQVRIDCRLAHGAPV